MLQITRGPPRLSQGPLKLPDSPLSPTKIPLRLIKGLLSRAAESMDFRVTSTPTPNGSIKIYTYHDIEVDNEGDLA